MKKIAIMAVSFALSACLMTACGGRNTNETTAPSTAPTTKPTTATTIPTTKPSTAATNPSSSGVPNSGVIDGNGDAANNSGKVGRTH